MNKLSTLPANEARIRARLFGLRPGSSVKSSVNLTFHVRERFQNQSTGKKNTQAKDQEYVQQDEGLWWREGRQHSSNEWIRDREVPALK
jgi:hypothetical protein